MENKKFKNLKFTGERMVNHPESLLYRTSLERYEFAGKYVKNQSVLDIACGSGYGSDYLSKNAKSVLGVDIDKETIDYCTNEYVRENLNFLQIRENRSLEDLRKKFDVIVSFETLEHVSSPENFLQSLKAVLKDGGILIMSTPNNFLRTNPPENKFHVHEFDILELYARLKEFFTGYQIEVFGQGKTNSQRIGETKKTNRLKILIQLIFKKIYNADKKSFDMLGKIEHLPVYQKISQLQSDTDFTDGIYKIDPDINFYNPAIALFLIKKP